jgi:hypothetical protein
MASPELQKFIFGTERFLYTSGHSMKTPFSIYLTGVLECIGGIAVLLMAVGITYVSLALPMPGGGPGRGILLGTAAVYGLLGVLGTVAGICVCMRKSWARWSTLAFSWFSLLMFGFMSVVFLAVPFPTSGRTEAARYWVEIIKIVAASLCLLIAATCGWWAWLFSRPRIKALFEEGGAEVGESGRPVSIAVIGWLWIVSGTMMLALATFPIAVGLWVLIGWKAAAVKVVWGGAYIALGWGLLKLWEWARQGSIAIILLGALNGLVFYVLPGRMERLQAILDWNPFRIQQTPAVGETAHMIWLGAVGGLLGILIPLYFLIVKRAAFAGGDDGGKSIGGRSASRADREI